MITFSPCFQPSFSAYVFSVCAKTIFIAGVRRANITIKKILFSVYVFTAIGFVKLYRFIISLAGARTVLYLMSRRILK
jgi:hypothetical protein